MKKLIVLIILGVTIYKMLEEKKDEPMSKAEQARLDEINPVLHEQPYTTEEFTAIAEFFGLEELKDDSFA